MWDWLFGPSKKSASKMSNKDLIKLSKKNRAGKVRTRENRKKNKNFKKSVKKGWF